MQFKNLPNNSSFQDGLEYAIKKSKKNALNFTCTHFVLTDVPLVIPRACDDARYRLHRVIIDGDMAIKEVNDMTLRVCVTHCSVILLRSAIFSAGCPPVFYFFASRDVALDNVEVYSNIEAPSLPMELVLVAVAGAVIAFIVIVLIVKRR